MGPQSSTKQDISSTPVDLAKALIKGSAESGAAILLSNLELKTGLKRDELRRLLTAEGATPYLTPFQSKSGMSAEASDDYRFPSRSVAKPEIVVATPTSPAFFPDQPLEEQIRTACRILLELVPAGAFGAKAMVPITDLKKKLDGMSRTTLNSLLDVIKVERGESYIRYRERTHEGLRVGVRTGSLVMITEALSKELPPASRVSPQMPSRWGTWRTW